MSVHTKGSWHVYSAPLRPGFPTPVIEIQDDNGEPIVKWTGFDGADQPKRTKLANARLMAASPELLAACEAALPFLDEFAAAGNKHAPAAVRLLRAAMRKATAK